MAKNCICGVYVIKPKTKIKNKTKIKFSKFCILQKKRVSFLYMNKFHLFASHTRTQPCAVCVCLIKINSNFSNNSHMSAHNNIYINNYKYIYRKNIIFVYMAINQNLDERGFCFEDYDY